MTEYQTLALQYATAVREYAELELHCRTSDLRQDQQAMRAAYDNMCNMQNALYFAAQKLAAADQYDPMEDVNYVGHPCHY